MNTDSVSEHRFVVVRFIARSTKQCPDIFGLHYNRLNVFFRPVFTNYFTPSDTEMPIENTVREDKGYSGMENLPEPEFVLGKPACVLKRYVAEIPVYE